MTCVSLRATRLKMSVREVYLVSRHGFIVGQMVENECLVGFKVWIHGEYQLFVYGMLSQQISSYSLRKIQTRLP